ncbi:hypothetical protein C9374_010906 [Naegleria lovaniensis]|uniref:N-acetyltransferase domain-containing protein n=1 Tax=Naegleria lovaniensis TaxID=51637 RepID=A0AA88GD59_NAELO|nr:uncharacterized protein C9374_010906 [Naegleria lovaniensis]KAG2374336.1 hypothetical protein C9374_010906 [Naegleria lovaniensis]
MSCRHALTIEALTPNAHHLAKEIIVKGLKERFGEENFDESFNPDLNQLHEAFVYFCVGNVQSVNDHEDSLNDENYSCTNHCNNNQLMIATGGLSLDFKYFGKDECCFRIERVSVLKEFRRRGYASQIVSHLMDVAKQIVAMMDRNNIHTSSSGGVDHGSNVFHEVYEKIEKLQPMKLNRKIVVETDTPWIEAVELYKKKGFTVVCEKEGCTHFELDF